MDTKNRTITTDYLDPLIPFVPAYELLSHGANRLSNEEVAAIALALYQLLPEASAYNTAWNLSGKLESISRRM